MSYYARRVVNAPRILAARSRLGVRTAPLSYLAGWDRGVPIHRHYIAEFMREFAADIQGHCLEFQDDGYTHAFGRDAVTRTDILSKDADNPRATLVADLTAPNSLDGGRFDCIVCVHVLHLVFELGQIVSELHRLLAPGGVLLVAVPHVSMGDPSWHEFWRFTPEGLQHLLSTAFEAEQITVRAYGNSLTAAAEIRGLVSDEFLGRELNTHDPRFAVEVCARAVKSVTGARAPRP